MNIYLAIGNYDLEQILKAGEYKIVDQGDSLDALEDLIEFLQVDAIVINRLLDQEENQIIEIAKKAKERNIKIIVVTHSFSSYEEQKYVTKLINEGITAFITFEDLTASKVEQLLKNYPEEFDFALFSQREEAEEKETIIEKIPKYFETANNNTVKEIEREVFVKTITIGVGSANEGAGSTHTSLGIAYYLVQRGARVAVAENNESPLLKTIQSLGRKISSNCFEYNNIDFYIQTEKNTTSNNPNMLFSVINNTKDYDYIILDLGLLKRKNENGIMQPNPSYYEMFRTNYQILCLNGALWKWGDINFYRCDDFAEVEPNIGSWNLIVNLTDSDTFRTIKSETRHITVIHKITKAPSYVNPFIQNEEVKDCFRQALYPILSSNEENKIKKMNFIKPLSIFNRP